MQQKRRIALVMQTLAAALGTKIMARHTFHTLYSGEERVVTQRRTSFILNNCLVGNALQTDVAYSDAAYFDAYSVAQHNCLPTV